MDTLIKKCIMILMAIVLWSSTVYASDLKTVFQLALTEDPLLGSASYQRYAAWGDKKASCRQLFPQVNIPGSFTSYDQDEAGTFLSQDSTTSSGSISGEQGTIGILISQTLFDMQKFTACRTERIKANRGDISYELAVEDLIYRVINTYLDILSAQVKANAAASSVDFYAAKLKHARRSFSAKTISSSKLDEYIAMHASARAAKMIADGDLLSISISLEEIINSPVHPEELSDLRKTIALFVPNPPDPEYWADISEQENLKLMESGLSVDVMKYGVKSATAKMLPRVDLFAKHTNYFNDINRTTGTLSTDDGEFSTEAVGVTMTWPLFTGGSNYAALGAARNRYMSTQELFEATRRNTRATAKKSMLSLLSLSTGVEAAQAVLTASRTNFNAVKDRVKVGSRTKTDLLGARRKVLESTAIFKAARYEYIKGLVEFWKVVGALSAGSIDDLNNMLASDRDIAETALTLEQESYTKSSAGDNFILTPDISETIMDCFTDYRYAKSSDLYYGCLVSRINTEVQIAKLLKPAASSCLISQIETAGFVPGFLNPEASECYYNENEVQKTFAAKTSTDMPHKHKSMVFND